MPTSTKSTSRKSRVTSPVDERDIRLEDYLNDKFQYPADFKNLNSILASVELQKEQLDKQLQDARLKLAESKKNSNEHSALILKQSAEFQRQQDEANKRLMAVTASDTPEEAIGRLKGPMEKLKRVQLARDYIELLKEVEDLCLDARRQLPHNPREALKPYTQLKELATKIQELQSLAEGSATHLVNHIQRASTQLWANMTKIMTDEFEAILKRANWPAEGKTPTQEWMDSFERLLQLQDPELVSAREPLILLPMGVLAKPLILQFKYHFSSDKASSQLSMLGDNLFNWLLSLIQRWEPFLRENVAPCLAAHFRGHPLAGNSLYVDPVSALITSLLPTMKEKIESVMKPMSRDPRLFSKFMGLLPTFDENLRVRFNYDGGNLDYGWRGIAWDITDTWFDEWLQIEKIFALQRYQEIIKSPKSGDIDYDGFAPGKTKPTFGANQVMDLLASVTDVYRTSRRFSHKVRFLIEIQAEILDQYQGRLSDSLDVYQTITSPIARTLHGVTKEQQAELEGIGGLESLCKVFGSAEQVIDILKEWSNQDFFLELWEELQDRARNTKTGENLAGPMSYAIVKESTSDAIDSNESGGVFDTTEDGFIKVQTRSKSYILMALKYNFGTALRNYLHKPQWLTVGDDDDSTPAITPELDQPLLAMKDQLQFLNKAIGTSGFRQICRETFDHLQGVLWNELLLKQEFTTLGASRFREDVLAIQRMIHSFPCMSNASVLYKLLEGSQLLSLPLKNEAGPTMMEAANAVFGRVEDADELLFEKMKFVVITRQEARTIMGRRREATT